MRIVSLVPSLTHTVCDFGLQAALVGCTNFCIAPPGLRKSATLIGGTKNPDLDSIAKLNPTHILVNEEENKPEHIAACKAIAPTYVSFPKSPNDVPALLAELGNFLGMQAAAAGYKELVENELAELDRFVERATRQGAWTGRRYLYYIWRAPYMVAAADTYINAMLNLVRYENAAPVGGRYPELTVEAAPALHADVLLLSSEPYPFRRRDAQRLREEWPAVPQMWRVDGQLFSWYGTMTAAALKALRAWVAGDGENGIVMPEAL